MVLGGPQGCQPTACRLLARFAHLAQERVTFVEFEPDLPLLLSQSDVWSRWLATTRSASCCYSLGEPCSCRARAVQEQLIRARLFAQRGIFDMVEPDALEPDGLMGKVLDALESPPTGGGAAGSNWPGCRAFASGYRAARRRRRAA